MPGGDRTAAPTDEPRAASRRALRTYLLAALAVTAIVQLGAALSAANLEERWEYVGAPEALQPYVHWDAAWYLSIADDGYSFDEDDASNTAFFPAFPLAIRGLMGVLDDPALAGVVVSLVSGAVALVAMGAWCRSVGRPDLARGATLALAISPFSLYLFGPVYSDGLFVAALLVACWALERDRALPLVLAVSVAATARVIGAAVPVLLAVRLLERRRAGEQALQPALPLVGYVAVAAHLAMLSDRFGDPLAFAQAASNPPWEEGLSVDSLLKLHFFEVAGDTTLSNVVNIATQLLGLAILLGALALLPRVVGLFGRAYAALAGVLLVVPLLSNNDFLGFGRYAIAAIPAIAALIDLLHERPLLAPRLARASAAALACTSLLYGSGYLIA